MANVSQILDRKGRDVLTIRPEQMVLDALKSMAEADVGSVMVMSGDAVEGIFTERQYARKVFLMGKASPTTPVRDVMERDVIFVAPDQSVEACMALMTEKRIRHLPVLSNGRLVGMISIGDLMKSVIDEHKFNIEQLVQYVQG
ncbi:CBS domain-containing protein [Tropicimonas isoalkanivorans]|uniref:CBS domain-containing protein n=1 Tax=Tropicimonas isoalkanivorans TaxID=441112 RepID=A0A1I1E936_9RHOB|nr:CBS domain-containing protein [Tropicimonas isoalkanivorans]SFB83112.1 CBS domain-containing protein [Tropicimonas isoalkanivorans]